MSSPAVRRVVLSALLLACTGAYAQVSPDPHARSLAATCANCHGSAGESSAGMPRLAGMPRDQLKRAMQEFKSGTRAGTVMPQLAKGYTDAQIDAIAAWFAAQSAR